MVSSIERVASGRSASRQMLRSAMWLVARASAVVWLAACSAAPAHSAPGNPVTGHDAGSGGPTTNPSGEGTTCDTPGMTRSCCLNGTQTCRGAGEFQVWGACLDSSGGHADCSQPVDCNDGEFHPTCDGGAPPPSMPGARMSSAGAAMGELLPRRCRVHAGRVRPGLRRGPAASLHGSDGQHGARDPRRVPPRLRRVRGGERTDQDLGNRRASRPSSHPTSRSIPRPG